MTKHMNETEWYHGLDGLLSISASSVTNSLSPFGNLQVLNVFYMPSKVEMKVSSVVISVPTV